MHSGTAILVLRKPLTSRIFNCKCPNLPPTRPISTQSGKKYDPLPISSSSSLSPIDGCDGSSSNCNTSSGNWNNNGVMRWVASGVFIIGSSFLGLCYCSSLSDSSSCFVAYADSQGQFADTIQNKPKFLFGDSYRRKVFFKYEKRIRLQSPPEKVFEYFASIQSPDGQVFMTPADLMRAVVPVFPPSEANRVREGSLRGEWAPGELHCAPSKFFMLFDTNNDGLVSFAEYIFFVTLLSIPESSFSVAFKMFDLDGNGEIDKDEFKKVMALMRSQNRQGSHHRDGMRHGLKVSGSVENGGLLEYFFGKDGKACLKHGRFVEFLRDLHEEILRLEFTHYDYNTRGTISAKDFALSMVASADMKHIDKFIRRVDELDNEPALRDIRITFEEFKNFEELRKSLRPLSIAIFGYGKVNGLLTKRDFQRAAYQVCGISLTDNLVDMIYYVFDANRDGNLSSEEFFKVLQRREGGVSLPREGGIMRLITCWLACTTNCSSPRLLHNFID